MLFILNLVAKIAFMAIFISLLYLVIDYFLALVVGSLNIPFFSLFSYLGVLQAIQVLISIAISSYVINKVISFISN